MKAIKCELCGSNELIKKDGEYECQYCHTKYTLEEAKKLLVEVSGDVNIKNMGNVENYVKIARNALKSNNNEEAENYCNKIIEIDAENYEAWIMKGEVAGWQSTIANDRILESINCFENGIKFAPEDKKEEIKEETTEKLKKLLLAFANLACEHYNNYPSADNATSIMDVISKILNAIEDFSKIVKNNFSETLNTIGLNIGTTVAKTYLNIYKEYVGNDGHPNEYEFENYRQNALSATLLLEAALKIITSDSQDLIDAKISIIKSEISMLEQIVKSCSYTKQYTSNGNSIWVVEYTLNDEAKQDIVNKIMELHGEIKKLDPTYVIPDRNTIKTKQGCYIASCVYGSYNCPQVWTLRRYRDYKLYTTKHGRLFIKLYYLLSPTIVNIFGKQKWFNRFFKVKLDKIVKKLQLEGYENTPYQDKF